MTSETRTFIQLSDIVGLESQCPNVKCKARISIPVENFSVFGPACPACREHWLAGPDVEFVRDFLERFSAIKRNTEAIKLFRLQVIGVEHDKES